MGKFLQSGRRRDVCVLLADEPRQAQALKSRLESHYDTRIEPKSFYGALESLDDAGFVERESEGIHDVYLLTEGGRRMLRDHVSWVLDHVDVEAEAKE